MKASVVPVLRMFPVLFLPLNKKAGQLTLQPQPFWSAMGLLIALVAGDYLSTIGANINFDLYGVGRWTLCITCAAGFEYLVRQYHKDRCEGGVPFSLCTEILALLYFLQCTILYVAYAANIPGTFYTFFYDLFDVWLVLGLAYALFQLGARSVVGSALLVVYGFLVVAMPLMLYVSYTNSFWYEASPKAYESAPKIDVENTYYRQAGLVESQVASVTAGVEGKSELYMVTFAPWSRQQVFWKEISYIHKLFDERFATAQHRASLVNQQSTLETMPLANLPNLRSTLKGVGKKMNVEEDILFLYLTSHGDKEGNLSAAFPRLDPRKISATDLKSALDDSGIRWRVVIVSACYSGRFVEAFRDEYTIVASAAAKDRQSFGCGNESEFTYFGEALFKDGLNSGKPLLQSILAARDLVAAREKRENKKPSRPQLWVGKKMRAKLEHFELEMMPKPVQ